MKFSKRHLHFLLLAGIVFSGCGGFDSIEKQLVSTDDQIRDKARLKLASLPIEKKETLIPALISNLKNPDSRVVNRALDALVVLGPQSIAGLQQSLQDPDIYTRLSAAAALGKLGPVAKASVPGLVACLQDAHPLMREEAAFALGSIGEAAASQASPVMLEMVNDADPNIRQTAKEALKKMGVQPPIRSS